jgi:hypothetical protein
MHRVRLAFRNGDTATFTCKSIYIGTMVAVFIEPSLPVGLVWSVWTWEITAILVEEITAILVEAA